MLPRLTPVAAWAAVCALVVTLASSGRAEDYHLPPIGSPAHGEALIAEKGCGGCHMIPGILGADGLVGPPLTMMGRRVFVAGLLRNTQQNWPPGCWTPKASFPELRCRRPTLRRPRRSTSRPISKPFDKRRRQWTLDRLSF